MNPNAIKYDVEVVNARGRDRGFGFNGDHYPNPILPVHVRFKQLYPDGQERRIEGIGDNFGSFAGAERWSRDRCPRDLSRVDGHLHAIILFSQLFCKSLHIADYFLIL